MAMCFSSSQISIILHLQKDVLILFFYWLLLWHSPQSLLSYIWLMFSTCCFLVIQVFSQKDICHVHKALWLLTDFLFLLFTGAYITPFWWVILFQNSAVVHKAALCVIPMEIRDHIRTGPLHMFKLFSSWICMSRQPYKVTSGQITVTVSSRQFETQGTKTQAKIWLTVLHRTQSIANIPAKTVNNSHISLYLQLQKILPDRFPVTHSVQN